MVNTENAQAATGETIERTTVVYRLFEMPCCKRQLDLVGSRLPNHCPECGEQVFSQLMTREHTLFEDRSAILELHR